MEHGRDYLTLAEAAAALGLSSATLGRAVGNPRPKCAVQLVLSKRINFDRVPEHNLLLVRRGYPPAIIYNRERPKYINALTRADRQGDVGALAELIARSVNDGINRFLLPSLAGPHRLVPVSALASASLTAPALRLAAERGRLRGQRQNGRWYSTRQWVDDYVASRYRRRNA